jgi:predicted ATPase
VLATVAEAVNVSDAGSLSLLERLEQALQDRELLLVLDNLEQVSDVAPALGELLATCRELRMLATSRAPLHVAAEREYPVGPLAEQDAAALFRQRAEAVRPGFAANGEVEEVCARLDRLPLAIELAASRAKALSAAQILERLDRRLPLLTGGPRDAPERQRTLRSAIAWSYDLLDPEERRLFARLGVFAGGFTLEAAEGVCDGDLDVLAALVDHSLVVYDGDRYSLLETVGEYARERLAADGNEVETRMRHAEWFADAAERELTPLLEGGDQAIAIQRLSAEQANAVAALSFAREEGLSELALRLAQALGSLWYFTGSYLTPGLQHLQATLSTFDSPASLRGAVLQFAGWISYDRGLMEQAQAYGEEALALRDEMAPRLVGEEGPAVRDQMTPFLVGEVLNLLGAIADSEGDGERARSYYEEALNLAATHWYRKRALNNLGYLGLAEGDLDYARLLLGQALGIARESGDLRHVAMITANLGLTEALADPPGRAAVYLGESLRICDALWATGLASSPCAGLALLTARLEEHTTSARVLGVVDSIARNTGVVVQSVELHAVQTAASLCAAALPPDDFERERERGQADGVDEAVAYALEVADRLTLDDTAAA